MAITDKNTLKSWFKRGLKPLESQFHAWMDSYWHKDEKIQTSDIEGLENTLNSKAEISAFDCLEESFEQHAGDTALHKTREEQYKLDHLVNDPNQTYATQEQLQELEVHSAIVIPVDFSKPEDDILQSIKDFVTPLFEDGTIFIKPLYLMYIWKEDYVTEGAPEYRRLIHVTSVETTFTTNGLERTQFKFNCPIGVMLAGWGDLRMAWCIGIRRSASRITVTLDDYVEESPIEVINAYENSDGIISMQDIDYGNKNINGWYTLAKELEKRNCPILFLRTSESGDYCPASYKFTVTDPNAVEKSYTGRVQISYIRETDGISELWVETRNFERFGNNTGQYTYPVLKKYPLGDSVRVSRIQVVETLPTEGLTDGDIVILKEA